MVGIEFKTASATITIPATVTKCRVTLVGGGQGGGGGTSVLTDPDLGTYTAYYGIPGNAGATLVKYLSGLTAGNTFALTVGAAGTGSAGGTFIGGNGGNSVLASGTQSITTLSAGGGSYPGAAVSINGDINIQGGVFVVRGPPLPTYQTILPGCSMFSEMPADSSAATGYGGGGMPGIGSGNGYDGSGGLGVFEWYA